MQKLSHNDHIDLYRHLAYCAVGGFFGCYAVLIHSGVMGNAQTVNLIELLLDALRGDLHAALLHLGALVLYVLGTMLTVLLPHWWGFGGARGFYSSTIFSTNNTKQTSLALANYLCDHDRAHLRKLKVFALTLLCFHIGAAAAYFAVTWWYIRGALAVLPLIAWAFFLSVCERRHEALAEEPETIPDSSAHPTSNA